MKQQHLITWLKESGYQVLVAQGIIWINRENSMMHLRAVFWLPKWYLRCCFYAYGELWDIPWQEAYKNCIANQSINDKNK